MPQVEDKNEHLNIKEIGNKANCGDIYNSNSPLPFYKWMDTQNYGESHDAFCQFVSSFVSDQRQTTRKTRIIDIGCSYGNTTLAVVDKLNWEQVGKFWKDESMTTKHKKSYHVTACDISRPALQYGQKRGYYDEIYIQNMNDPLPKELQQNIIDADMLCVYMIFCYFERESFQRLIDLFLSDRKREKYIFYNFTPIFQEDLILTSTPDKFLAKHAECTFEVQMSLHRDLTEEERAKFEANGRNLGKESCNFIFGIKCAALNARNECIIL